MSENEELTVDDGPPASAFQLHRESSYKKREVYEKLVASKKIPFNDGASSSSIMAQSVSNPGPSSLPNQSVSRPPRQSAAKRDSNSTSSMLSVTGHPFLSVPFLPSSSSLQHSHQLPASIRWEVSECKRPLPAIVGENMFIECSLLKSNILLLKDALSNPNMAVSDLQILANEVKKAKDLLMEKVSLPLDDIQKELQDQISNEHAVFHAKNLFDFRTLPLTHTAANPYPSQLYLYPDTEQLPERRVPHAIPDPSCIPSPPYNAQSAH